MPNDANDISLAASRNASLATNNEITQDSKTTSLLKASNKSTKGGRPKGTTNKQTYDLQKHKLQALIYTSVEVSNAKNSYEGIGWKWVKQGEYNNILTMAHKKFDIPEEISLCKDTMMSHLKPGRKLLVVHHGPVSPMVSIKAYLIDLILQLAYMQQPIMPKIFLAFMNSMVQGTITANEIVECKKEAYTPAL